MGKILATKHVELIEIINKLLLVHLVGCLGTTAASRAKHGGGRRSHPWERYFRDVSRRSEKHGGSNIPANLVGKMF